MEVYPIFLFISLSINCAQCFEFFLKFVFVAFVALEIIMLIVYADHLIDFNIKEHALHCYDTMLSFTSSRLTSSSWFGGSLSIAFSLSTWLEWLLAISSTITSQSPVIRELLRNLRISQKKSLKLPENITERHYENLQP